jgi:hypothetical protein
MMTTVYWMTYLKIESRTIRAILCVAMLLLCQTSKAADTGLLAAEKMLDAFYSFDQIALAESLVPGDDADRVLYYQAWAQAANYRIKTRRPCVVNEDAAIQCAITVFDDFGETLDYIATDTFYLIIKDNKIIAARFEGDDPLIFSVLYVWMMVFRSELLDGPCKNMFEGGDTPAECSKGVVHAARDFVDVFYFWLSD